MKSRLIKNMLIILSILVFAQTNAIAEYDNDRENDLMNGQLFGYRIGKQFPILRKGCVSYYGGNSLFSIEHKVQMSLPADDLFLILYEPFPNIHCYKPFAGGRMNLRCTRRTGTIAIIALEATFTSGDAAKKFANRYIEWFRVKGAKIGKKYKIGGYDMYDLHCGDYKARLVLLARDTYPVVRIRYTENPPINTSEDTEIMKLAEKEATNPIDWTYCDRK